MIDIKDALKEDAEFIEKELDTRLNPELLGGGKMAEAMRYAVLGGGKRIRAFLTIEFCKLFGGTKEMAASYASSIEMIHAYSLIHDDMPCMDNDDFRRGKPSTHKAFGEDIALLAGDSLLTYAFENAVLDFSTSDRINRYAGYELSHCAGALGMCGGQEIDLLESCSSYSELCHLHNLKTGALIKCASMLGYYAACEKPDNSIRDKIESYALSIGLAFQIIDDLLDVRSTAEELGKPVGSDERNGKKTVLSFMDYDEAFAEAERLSNNAAHVFADFENSEIICSLPTYLLNRTK